MYMLDCLVRFNLFRPSFMPAKLKNRVALLLWVRFSARLSLW